MRTRILIHYSGGLSYGSQWDESDDFKNLCKDPISSIQIQEENGTTHTLSSKKKQFNIFWQRDIREEGKIIIRSILRRLSKNVWLDLSLDCITGKRTITIIKEDIKVK